MTQRIAPIFFLFTVVCLAAACSSRIAPTIPNAAAFETAPQAALTAPHAVIPFGINAGNDPGLNLALSVGDGKARPFLFDTGSSGFWVYANAIGTNYTATKYQMTNTYSSGLVYNGTVVYTTVNFGTAQLTATNVPVVRVDRASCDSTRPTCPASPSPKNCPGVNPKAADAGILCVEAGRKLFGTFGADLQPTLVATPVPSPSASAAANAAVATPVKAQMELYNALFAIAPWASTFVVTPTALEVGPRSTAGFTLLKLKRLTPLPKPLPPGAHGWHRDVVACYTIGKSLVNKCVDTVFDTGARFIDFQMNGLTLPLTNTPKCDELVTKGTPFAVRMRDGTSLTSFFAGYVENANAIVTTEVDPLYKQNQVNTGLTFYNRFAILFDAANGTVGLRRLKSPGTIGEKNCQ